MEKITSEKDFGKQASTLFSIESKNGFRTYYFDYEPDYELPYRLYKDEVLVCSRESLGEILEVAFRKLGSTHLKLM
jgi:hypothetical protein